MAVNDARIVTAAPGGVKGASRLREDPRIIYEKPCNPLRFAHTEDGGCAAWSPEWAATFVTTRN